MKKLFGKGFSIMRDTGIYTLLNMYGLKDAAYIFQWATTSTHDVVVFTIASKLGITSIQSKYLILLIIAFLT